MAPSPTIRRLLKETAELSSPTSSPNPAFFAAPLSDSNLHEWHFTLLGPPSPSPYAGGLYHGRITLPPTYPLKPPNFRFLTPSGRFEVNREICLSISGFHEETWMPAWGVRTALTALRSFMAEKGTAGQVGGLESPEHVRRSLAKESRGWRCEGCARTNEQVMREWWAVCRDAGLKFEEEELGLDLLPAGMSLEARDPTKKDAAQGSPPQPQREIPVPAIVEPEPEPEPKPPAAPAAAAAAAAAATDPETPPRPAAGIAVPLASTPSAEAVQASAEAYLTPSDLELPAQATTPRRSPFSGIHAPPMAAANAAVRRPQAMAGRPAESRELITIDRAIAGVFVALVLMVLKKIFYPAGGAGEDGSAGGGGGGGGLDFYLQRE